MLDQRDYSYLTWRCRDGIAFATRNRPEQQNRYSSDEEAEYPRFLREASQHPDVRVIVVTGAGDEWFCAGVDLPSRHADIEYDAYVGSGRTEHAAVPVVGGPRGPRSSARCSATPK